MEFTLSANGKWLAFNYEKVIKSKENPNYIAVINVEKKLGSKGELLFTIDKIDRKDTIN